MAGIFGLGDLQARKAALAAESELYRQTLRLEIQNLRFSVLRARKRVTLFRSSTPWFLLLIPLLRSSVGSFFLGRRRFGRMRLISTGVLLWQMYRKVAPILQQLFANFRSHSKSEPAEEEETTARK